MKRPEDATRAPTVRSMQRDPVRRRLAARGALGLLLYASALAACNLDNPGVSAPTGTISYPIAVATSHEPRPRYLYVANSNFDLAFSAGSVQSYDLGALSDKIDADGCRAPDNRNVTLDGGVVIVNDGTSGAPLGDGGVPLDAGPSAPGTIALPPDYAATSQYGNERGVLCDGRDPDMWRRPDVPADARRPRGHVGLWPPVRCCYDEGNQLAQIRRDEQPIDSFASGIAVAPDNNRVYVPISSRARLVYLDVDAEGALDCGGESGRCRRGPDPDDDDGDDPMRKFPGQPGSMVVGKLGQLGAVDAAGLPDETTFIATAHELGGFGLFLDRGTPVLENAITGLPLRPTALVLNPAERLLYLASAGDSNLLTRVGVSASPTPGDEAKPRGRLFRALPVAVTGFAQNRDIRDAAFDPRQPAAVYAKRVYALVRGLQESLAFLELDGTVVQNARLVDAVRVGAGPRKVDFIELDGRGFLLVSCYDARSVFVIDADRRALVSVVRNLAGPFEMTFDAGRKLLYVADFRASAVRVVDLAGVTDKREPPPRIIATLGLPRFQGGLQ